MSSEEIQPDAYRVERSEAFSDYVGFEDFQGYTLTEGMSVEPLFSESTIRETKYDAVVWKCKGCGNVHSTMDENIEPEMCSRCGMKTRWEKESELVNKQVFSSGE